MFKPKGLGSNSCAPLVELAEQVDCETSLFTRIEIETKLLKKKC
jgi:hypothetical protein